MYHAEIQIKNSVKFSEIRGYMHPKSVVSVCFPNPRLNMVVIPSY